MNSAESRALISKEKELKSDPLLVGVQKKLPLNIQGQIASYLFGKKPAERLKTLNRINFFDSVAEATLFQSMAQKTITRIAHCLAHRIEVEKALAFLKKYPRLLQTLPLPIQITDKGGRKITRHSIMGVLVALDEFNVTEGKPGAENKPHGLIPTLFSLFKEDNARNKVIKSQLQQQLQETSGSSHKDASKARRDRYLKEIEILIHDVIKCDKVSNNSYATPFADLLNLELIQNFINNAFKPDPNDNGELGVVWDCWQLYLDHLNQLENYRNNEKVTDKSRPNLGGWGRKAYLVDAAVYMAFMRCSQFCHLEVFAKGVVTVERGNAALDRFDCSKSLPEILVGIGSTHCFDFFDGEKLSRAPGVAGGWGTGWALGCCAPAVAKLLSNKNISITVYAPPPGSHHEQLSDTVEIRRSPSATATGQ